MEEIKLRTTTSAIEEFKESILWEDIKRELGTWKEGFKIEQDCIVDDAAENNPSTASVLLHMGDLNGRIKAVDYVLGILDVFTDILNLEKEIDEEEVSDG